MIRLVRLLALVVLGTGAGHAEELRLAVTTSFSNSGLAEILLPAIDEDTGIEVQLVVVGTGQAIRLGEAGDVDAILVHSRPDEQAFVAAGHGTHRRKIMYNDFVLVGPRADPARVADAATVRQALSAIAGSRAPFVSRGDDSGTHRRELALWAAAGLEPQGAWYRAVGTGMGASLNIATGMGAYILTDRASWLNFGNKADFKVVFAGDEALFNQYSYIPVSADKHPGVRDDLAAELEEWLTSEHARDLIDGYSIQGEQLFTFNAEPAE